MNEDVVDLTERYAQLPMPLDQWLAERVANCERHAEMAKSETDRKGWLEDALYFEAALALIMGIKHNLMN